MQSKTTRIKRLVLQNFKSFRKNASIELHPNLTIFCGPNGSGKSNLCDAIAFVLGRLSAKSLRADRLHELIFHGGNGKPPAKQASITIYLDNKQKIFPFEEDEISICRKVNQNGAVVYKLNGRTATREKVLQVLSAARIYPDGHNIVFQGDITQLVEMSPTERRLILDEVSGVAEYDEKKQKAERDLQFVDQKLREAELLIQERYNIFQKLERERNAALRFQELSHQLKLLKASYLNKRCCLLEEKLRRLEEKLEKKIEQNKLVEHKIARIEEELERKENELRKFASRILNLSKKVEAEKKITQLRAELLLEKSKLELLQKEEERVARLIDRLHALQQRKRELTGRIPFAVKKVLEQKFKGVYGCVKDLLQVPEKYRSAIEIALLGRLFDLVVEDEETAKRCIEFLKEERLGIATFLPIATIKPRSFTDYEVLHGEGVVGIASSLVSFDTKFMRVVQFLLGDTLVVENLETAKKLGIGKFRMATLQGELLERSGAIVGGYFPKLLPSFEEAKELEEYLVQRKRILKEREKIEERISQLEQKLSKLSAQASTQEVLALEKIKITSQRELDELRERRRNLYERRISLQSETNNLQVEKARIQAELQTLREELSNYGEIKYLDENLQTIAKLLQSVEKELRSLGPVNFRAIEDYEIFKKEFEKYKQRYEKILEEKKAVLKLFEEIEQKRKETFYRCLNAVNAYFNLFFNKLTDGTAELLLEDPDNLESGLLIRACPKGKSLVSIDALSGGEKTLAALAFIFAIQKFKPAPFYLLDEVDASLDKENTKKVMELIKELSSKSQFLLITHNDQTIRYGDVVYGVTMVDGESKLLGIELPKE